MKYLLTALALSTAFASSSPALAVNEFVLRNPGDLSNFAEVEMSGDNNLLVIDQTLIGNGAGNRVTVAITGNNNGGPAGMNFTSVAARSNLTPGEIIQSGFGNSVSVNVTGSDNLFAYTQMGNNNSVHATVVGSRNEAAVSQVGNGNLAYYSQTGVGNSVNITQIAR